MPEREFIPFFSCNMGMELAAVRALCEASRGPIIETNEQAVWAVNGDPSDTKSSSYLFILEVSKSDLFAFPVNGSVFNCISDYYNGRGILCFILETGTSDVALYRYVYSVNDEGWLETDAFPGFVSDRGLLTSSSFVLEYCDVATPFVIVGTTQGVQSIPIIHDPYMHKLVDLQAAKLLRHHQCNSMLYILTLDVVQVYNVNELQQERLQPLNWSVAELSLDGTRIAFAGSHHDQSCWMQVWNTANQDVVLSVTRDDCNIASIAVSQMHVCYHMTNITGQEWKLACLQLERNNDEVVLANGHQWGLKDRSLTLDGNVLVEKIWDAIDLYDVREKTILHTYKSKYPTLAYLPGASGVQDNRCRIRPPPDVHPSPTVQHPSTPNTASLSESATPTEEPTTTTRSKSSESAKLWIIGFCMGVFIVLCICVSLTVLIGVVCCIKKGERNGYRTKEEHLETLNSFVQFFRDFMKLKAKVVLDV